MAVVGSSNDLLGQVGKEPVPFVCRVSTKHIWEEFTLHT